MQAKFRRDLPNFFPRSAFLAILAKRFDEIQAKPVEFITDIWVYIDVVMSSVIIKHIENFPQFQSSIKRSCQNLISKIKEESLKRVIEMIEMEKLTDYTCNHEYITVHTQKIAPQTGFITALQSNHTAYSFTASSFGVVEISHLRKYDVQLVRQAFDMKMRITAYWSIVVRRIVDYLALYLQFSVKNFVNIQFEEDIMALLVNHGGIVEVEKMLEKSPSETSKRERLKKSIKPLKESKDVVATIIDR